MIFSVDIPVKIISGRGCILNNQHELIQGKRAFIVTGKAGAKSSGALNDVLKILCDNSINAEIFSGASENPPLEIAYQAGKLAIKNEADFIIGIGGGSAMDAAKAVAAFAANPEIAQEDIFNSKNLKNGALPIVLVPTTAGTGSEANPYSVLSLPDGERKKTYSSRFAWAKVAFLDPAYTESLAYSATVSTALDAFAHALESYLSPKSNALSAMLAEYAAKNIWEVLTQMPDEFTAEHRDMLCYASCAAGAAISITGTGFPHPLGYSLTMLSGVPHGRACAVFHGDYIEYNMRTPEGEKRLNALASALSTTPRLMQEFLPGLADVHITLTDEEIKKYVDLIKGAKNYANSPYVLNEDEMLDIYRKHFTRKRGK
ncbi:MAG: iron-containing alcohol dehydrogenase [Eubacteriales bacterium]